LLHRINVRAAYTAIHARNVVHHDLAPRHIIFDPAGRARIIDFDRAEIVGTDMGRNVSLEREERDVEGLLDRPR